jgi:hypothetical protein
LRVVDGGLGLMRRGNEGLWSPDVYLPLTIEAVVVYAGGQTAEARIPVRRPHVGHNVHPIEQVPNGGPVVGQQRRMELVHHLHTARVPRGGEDGLGAAPALPLRREVPQPDRSAPKGRKGDALEPNWNRDRDPRRPARPKKAEALRHPTHANAGSLRLEEDHRDEVWPPPIAPQSDVAYGSPKLSVQPAQELVLKAPTGRGAVSPGNPDRNGPHLHCCKRVRGRRGAPAEDRCV